MDVALKQKREEKAAEQHAKEEKKRKVVPAEFFAPHAHQQAQHTPQITHMKTFFGDKLIESHVHNITLPFERAKEKFVDKKGKQAGTHIVRVMRLIDKLQEKSREVLGVSKRKKTKGKDK